MQVPGTHAASKAAVTAPSAVWGDDYLAHILRAHGVHVQTDRPLFVVENDLAEFVGAVEKHCGQEDGMRYGSAREQSGRQAGASTAAPQAPATVAGERVVADADDITRSAGCAYSRRRRQCSR